jgi:hypothetical protein
MPSFRSASKLIYKLVFTCSKIGQLRFNYAQYRHEEIPRALSEFRKINYTDLRMQKVVCLGRSLKAIFG